MFRTKVMFEQVGQVFSVTNKQLSLRTTPSRYGQAFIAPEEAEPYKNVQCENCHGLNPGHPQDPVNHPWGAVKETSCLTCHNKNQTRIDFVFSRERRKVACPPLKRN